MSKNPQAFPSGEILTKVGNTIKKQEDGMTLHDYFVGQALIGILSRMEQHKADAEQHTLEKVSRLSFKIADAVLEERLKGEGRE